MLPLVIYHKGCADGAGAAYAAWCKFGEAAEYRPAQHGDPAPTADEVAGRTVYILDFSYPLAELNRMATVATSVEVVDHHKSAMEALSDLAPLEATDRALRARFDMTKSGAVLAWEHFHPGKEVPDALLYVQDRDLWQWRLPNSRAISAAMMAEGAVQDFRKFHFWEIGSHEHARLIDAGEAILAYQSQMVESICKNAEEVKFGEHAVLAVNTPVLQSEVAGKLAEGRPFGLAWFRAHGKFVVSLRSSPEGADVQAIAKQFGGGGHVHAAGFSKNEWAARPWTDSENAANKMLDEWRAAARASADLADLRSLP